MGHRIWCANGKSAVQHTGQEGDSVAPTCRVVLAKVTPHSRVTGMNFGHRRDHDDRHEATDNDEEKANVI